ALAMTGVMLLWNYFITPLYMGFPRDAVAAMLLPVFLPFNLIKGGLNAAITMLLYKPLVMALRKAGMVPQSRAATAQGEAASKLNLGVVLVAALVVVSCVLFILANSGVI
ncbi:ECF transporter S component, partial [Clostridia bacterium OttesenSCG-928-O13]|nr:ECF transporter S component [Clostridia bacterium OttesenSCG-928-O13]